MAVELTLGAGQPNFKTSAYRAAKPLAASAGFRYLDNIACTPLFFRHFLEKSGALFAKTNEDARKCIRLADFPKQVEAQIKDAVYSLPSSGLNRLCLYVRSDEPWEGAGTGLGSSHIAIRPGRSQKSFIDYILHSIKLVLESQFDDLGNVAEFKRLKGATEDFGALLMPVFATFYPNRKDPQRIFAPSLSVNFLGKAYGKALMQCSRGFFSSSYYGVRDVEYARGRSFSGIDMRDHTTLYGTSALKPFLPIAGLEEIPIQSIERTYDFRPADGLDKRVSKLLETGGNCYFEAVRKDHYPSKIPGWALTQYVPVNMSPISFPDVDDASVIQLPCDAIGMAVARTKGVHVLDSTEPQDSIDFNRNNKGHLLLCHVGSLELVKELPLSAFSNAGAIIFAYSQREYVVLSHLSGYLRELKVPILLTHDYRAFDVIKEHDSHIVYANEFTDNGFIARL